jgi:hypothetical protein
LVVQVYGDASGHQRQHGAEQVRSRPHSRKRCSRLLHRPGVPPPPIRRTQFFRESLLIFYRR